MASIIDEPNGRRRIEFGPADARKRIRLGKVDRKSAESFCRRIEKMIAARALADTLDRETAEWLAGLSDTLHARIAAIGLVKPRNRQNMTLEAFLAKLFSTLAVKPNTLLNYTKARNCLEEYFGTAKPLRDVEPMDADQYRSWLASDADKAAPAPTGNKAKGLSPATVSKWIIIARQLFKRAVKWKLIAENPFADVKAGSQANKARMFYVTPDMAAKVLDACPDAQWRLMFALSRYGGLRCPSEHLALKWSDVDWERNRITVNSSKTEHHEGGDCRILPLFPELRPFLLKVFDEAEPGTEHVITRYRDTRQNLRTQLCRIIKRAGLKPWPKPWHNLRSTRQTELAERYPIHVVCSWLGNSRAVAQAHYLQVTDAHFAQAVAEPQHGQEQAAEEEARKAAQYPAGSGGNGQELVSATNAKGPGLPSLTDHNSLIHKEKRSRQESNL